MLWYLYVSLSLLGTIATPRPNMVLLTFLRVLKPSVITRDEAKKFYCNIMGRDRYHKNKKDKLKSTGMYN
jgi:hypothetical protein